MTNKTTRGIQACDTFFRLFVGPGNIDQDTGSPAVGRDLHLVHGGQADARVAEFAFYQGGNLFP